MKIFQKSISLLLLALIFSISFSACESELDKRRRNLGEFVAGLEFPQKINDDISMSGCEYRDNVLIIKYEISKKKVFKKIDADRSSAKALNRLKSELLPRSFTQKLIAAKASLKCVFYCGDDSTSFSFTPEEMSD